MDHFLFAISQPNNLDVNKTIVRPTVSTFQQEVNTMMLENKVALVTGGTSGIGRATAIALGASAAKVVFSGRRDAEGEETAALIRDTGA